MSNNMPFDAAAAVAQYTERTAYIEDSNPRPAFVDEMRSYGFEMPAMPVMGKVERVQAPGDKKGKRNGWYIYNEIPDDYQPGAFIGVGVFGDWKGNPERVVWTSKRRESMSPTEAARFEEQLRTEKIAREEEAKARRAAAAAKAESIWAEATAAPPEHPYLAAKQIQPHGVKVSRGKIVVPVQEKGWLVSLQFIDMNGGKMFLAGGKTGGCSYKIAGDDTAIYVAEGFATGATLAEVTGNTVYVAYNAGNLLEATSQARDAHPDSEIVIAGDDDHKTPGNPGRSKAVAAGDVMRCKVIFPDVDGDDTDFNDMAKTKGIEAVRELIQNKPTVYQRAIEYDDMPAELLNPPGILGDVVAYYNATARAPQPGFAVQTALALGSIVCGRHYSTTKGNFSSLYFLNVAKSGTGKEHAKTVLEQCLAAGGLEELINGNGYTSAGAVFSTALRRPRHITVIDEFGRYLEASKAGKNSNLLEANTQLMEVIGRLGGTMRPTSYSTMTLTKDKAEEFSARKVHNPAITLLTMTTPVALYKNLDSDAVADGFLGRFLIHQSNQPRMVHDDKDMIDVPNRISEWVKKITDRAGYDPSIDMPSEKPNIISLAISGPSMRELREFNQYQVDMANKLEMYGLEALPGRVKEFAMRLALICTLAKDPNATIIDDPETVWAIKYVKFALDQTISVFKMRISGSEHEGNKKEILQAIRDTGANGSSWIEMQKTPPYSKMKARELKEILTSLTDAELIVYETVQNGKAGRPRVAYIAIQ